MFVNFILLLCVVNDLLMYIYTRKLKEDLEISKELHDNLVDLLFYHVQDTDRHLEG